MDAPVTLNNMIELDNKILGMVRLKELLAHPFPHLLQTINLPFSLSFSHILNSNLLDYSMSLKPSCSIFGSLVIGQILPFEKLLKHKQANPRIPLDVLKH